MGVRLWAGLCVRVRVKVRVRDPQSLEPMHTHELVHANEHAYCVCTRMPMPIHTPMHTPMYMPVPVQMNANEHEHAYTPYCQAESEAATRRFKDSNATIRMPDGSVALLKVSVNVSVTVSVRARAGSRCVGF